MSVTKSKPSAAPLTTHVVPPAIEATVRVDVKRGIMWILGDPHDIERDPDDETCHSCDQWGCSSAGAHVLAVVRFRADDVGTTP